jgi:hypothetical protein
LRPGHFREFHGAIEHPEKQVPTVPAFVLDDRRVLEGISDVPENLRVEISDQAFCVFDANPVEPEPVPFLVGCRFFPFCFFSYHPLPSAEKLSFRD